MQADLYYNCLLTQVKKVFLCKSLYIHCIYAYKLFYKGKFCLFLLVTETINFCSLPHKLWICDLLKTTGGLEPGTFRPKAALPLCQSAPLLYSFLNIIGVNRLGAK